MTEPAGNSGQPQAGTGSSDALLDTFGGLERSSRPELALSEREFRKDQAAKATATAIETEKPAGRPEGEETPEETREEAPPKGEPKEKAKPEGEEELEELPEGEEPEDLVGLLSQHRKKTSLAAQLREFQRLQKKGPEDKQVEKELRETYQRLDQLAALFDEHFEEESEGKYVLKAEAAARALQSRRGQLGGPPPGIPDAKEVRKQVESEFRSDLSETVAPEDLDTVLDSQKMKARIAALTKERIEAARTAQNAYVIGLNAEVGAIVQKHLAKHPDDEALLPEMDKVVARFPEQLRAAAIVEGWVDLPELAEMIRFKKEMPALVRKAYRIGLRDGQKKIQPADAGAPGRGGAGRKPGRGDTEADQAFKDAILGAGALPPLVG